ncbi:MAG: hypothetical protein PHY47_18765 [Lachnospiraceae bacterium]|nr:hypothetical protein [Lachnospiraceae bacterium]
MNFIHKIFQYNYRLLICQMGKGIIALPQNNPEKAELYLLEAEQKNLHCYGSGQRL